MVYRSTLLLAQLSVNLKLLECKVYSLLSKKKKAIEPWWVWVQDVREDH